MGRDVQAQHAPAPRRPARPADLADPRPDGARLARQAAPLGQEPERHRAVVPVHPLGPQRRGPDEAIPKNPCAIPGAGNLKAAERPTATPEQVAQLIEAITPRYRAAVVLAAWCGLRRGEVCALRVTDVNLEEGTVRVHKNWVELLQAPVRFEKDPKTDAGKRTVNIPPHVIPLLEYHLRTYAGPEFFNVGLDGHRARGDTVYQAFVRARHEVGIQMTFHDLRHTGQTMAAAAGANLADLMRRLGHSSSVAALRYLHAVEGRDKEIAQNLSRMAQTQSLTHLYPPPSTRPPSGPSI